MSSAREVWEGMVGDWVYMPSEGMHAPPIVQLYGPWPGEGWREMTFAESVVAHVVSRWGEVA